MKSVELEKQREELERQQEELNAKKLELKQAREEMERNKGQASHGDQKAVPAADAQHVVPGNIHPPPPAHQQHDVPVPGHS
ncbi:unnamed protein product [Ophioblennius macclurei]